MNGFPIVDSGIFTSTNSAVFVHMSLCLCSYLPVEFLGVRKLERWILNFNEYCQLLYYYFLIYQLLYFDFLLWDN